MPAGFLVELTAIRPLHAGDPMRNERTHPEVVLESVPADGQLAAQTLFAAFCHLSTVQQGKQRPKLIPLSGLETDCLSSSWGAPLVTHRSQSSGGTR